MLLDRFLFASHLQPDEHLIYVIHEHWVAVFRSAFKISFFGIFLPILFYLMFPPALWFFVLWLVAGFVVFFYAIVDWYFDVILVTSQGVVHLDWKGIFNKSSHRADFESVAGVIYEQPNFWSHLFNYGALLLDKEGAEEERIFLSHAENPIEAERQVLLAKETYAHEHAMESEEALKEILSNLVAQHVRREKGKKKLADLL